MIRRIIEINSDACDGCGLCVTACHENAIILKDGKANLLRDDYCDGLGDCLPACPQDAIRFIEREALAYDEEAVLANIRQKKLQEENQKNQEVVMNKAFSIQEIPSQKTLSSCASLSNCTLQNPNSALKQWPVQIKLAPIKAPYFNNSHILIAADCTAYAYADFHQKFIKDRVCLIGCPKLDEGNYADKLTEIIKQNEIKSLSVVRMEVPCCGGIERAVQSALAQSSKDIPYQVTTISTQGEIV